MTEASVLTLVAVELSICILGLLYATFKAGR